MPNGDGEQNNPLVADSFFLASIPALAYITAFGYELGYCYKLDIPFSLINLNFSTIIFVSLAVASLTVLSVVLFSLYCYLWSIFGEFPDLDEKERVSLFQGWIASYVVALLLGAFWANILLRTAADEPITSPAVFGAGAVIPLFLLSTAVHRLVLVLHGFEVDRLDVLNLGSTKLGISSSVGLLSLLIIIAAFTGAYIFGTTAAHVLQEHKGFQQGETVLLRIYGDTVVSAPIETATRKPEKRLDVEKLGNPRWKKIRVKWTANQLIRTKIILRSSEETTTL